VRAEIYLSLFSFHFIAASYDDEKGQFVMEVGDHIAYRYEIVKILGKGSFSTVPPVDFLYKNPISHFLTMLMRDFFFKKK
jgi:hypothetical protein